MSGGAAALTSRNITKALYEAAREAQREPLTYLAARTLLERLEPRRSVLIAVGFFDPPSMANEADGALGGALLAKSLCVAFDATPILVTEVANMRGVRAVAEAVGLEVVPVDVARSTPFKTSVLPLPVDPARATALIPEILDRTDPAAIITIEKPAPNAKGRYHTGVGLNVTNIVGKITVLLDAARARGIATIGIGDGGNEAGMGKIVEASREVLPTGARCHPTCGCDGGIATVTDADVLVVAGVANWGSYGIEACLAAALGMPEAIHSLVEERRATDAAARAGLIDAATGAANGWVDGTPPVCSESILELVRQMAELRLAMRRPNSIFNFPKRWVERGAAPETLRAWSERIAEQENDFFARDRSII